MLSQRNIRFQKRKIIGGSFLKNVYDKVRRAVSSGSKILNRVPPGVKSEIKKAVVAKLTTAQPSKKPTTSRKTTTQPSRKTTPETALNDRSRAILSNLIAGSGFKNYIF